MRTCFKAETNRRCGVSAELRAAGLFAFIRTSALAILLVWAGGARGPCELKAAALLPIQVPEPNGKAAALPPLPPLPRGVLELKFGDFFVSPVGPHGLELTGKLRQMDGKRVRILGYMVCQDSAPPGMCMMTSIPMKMHEQHDHCFIDDLPASRLHVISPNHAGRKIPYAPGLLLLTGTLSVGNRIETDGQLSIVRLTLDPTRRAPGRNPAPGTKGAEQLAKTAPVKRPAAQ